MTNWKTTTIGVLTIASGVIASALSFFKTGVLDLTPLISVVAGVGLIKAADSKK